MSLLDELRNWKADGGAEKANATSAAGESKLVSEAVLGAWVICPDGTAQQIKKGQNRRDVCGDQT
ncbi:MAG TPA: hypothetical protein V6C89_01615 [Drouetiella sp.]